MSTFEFIVFHLPEIGIKLGEQIYLVGTAISAATLIGVPLGILICTMSRLRTIVLGVTGILQTIPSLALLAFLLPFFGIGAKPAIIALTLYALLPIVTNTLTGLRTLSEEMIEAAQGLGFNYWQRLWMVEIPLALPTIVAGIRTSMTICVGIATLAAFIGAGGLGDFINRGLVTVNTHIILLGAIPAALLALTLDFLIAQLEQAITERRQRNKFSKRGWFALVVLLLIFSSVFIKLINNAMFNQAQQKVTVASKNFTEQFIIAEIFAKLIEEKTDLIVDRKFNLGSTHLAHTALIKGEIDLYPAYTATAYTTILGQSNLTRAEDIFTYVKQEYEKQWQVTWLAPLGFENQTALIIKPDFANRNNIKNVSDLRRFQEQLVLSTSHECTNRPDCLLLLQSVYQLSFKEVKKMETNIAYQALENGVLDIMVGFTTDARIARDNLIVLADDQQAFASYQAAPVVRLDTLAKYPQLYDVFALLDNILTAEKMRQLNSAVELDKRSPVMVAHEFLFESGLLVASTSSASL